MTAKGFANFLRENKNIFIIISNLLVFNEVLFNILQAKHFDILYCSKKIIDFQNQLKEERENFDSIWSSITENSDEFLMKTRRIRQTEIDQKDYYRRLYIEIIDNIHTQIDIRFKSFEKFQYLGFTKSY